MILSSMLYVAVISKFEWKYIWKNVYSMNEQMNDMNVTFRY